MWTMFNKIKIDHILNKLLEEIFIQKIDITVTYILSQETTA